MPLEMCDYEDFAFVITLTSGYGSLTDEKTMRKDGGRGGVWEMNYTFVYGIGSDKPWYLSYLLFCNHQKVKVWPWDLIMMDFIIILAVHINVNVFAWYMNLTHAFE